MKNSNKALILSWIIVPIIAGCLAFSCKPEDRGNSNFPTIPDPRPPTLEELFGASYEMFWQYDPSVGSPADAWRGTTKVTFLAPQAGFAGLRAELEFVSGFEGAEACLENGRATWTYDDGRLEIKYATDDMTEILLSGRIERKFYAVANGPVGSRPTQHPNIVYQDNAAGGWHVNKGTTCEDDDFSPGNNGHWTIGEGLLIIPATTDTVRTAVYFFDEDGPAGFLEQTVTVQR